MAELGERRAVQLAILAGAALVVLSPSFARHPQDDFPLSPYGMFAEDKDETTTVTQAVVIGADGAPTALGPRAFGTDEVLQARAMLARAADRGRAASKELCVSLAKGVAGDPARAGAKEVRIRTVTYHSLAYFQSPDVAPLKEKVHARCPVGAPGAAP